MAETIDLIKYCNILKSCGHECDGIQGESKCLPCIREDCMAENVAEQIKRDFKAYEHELCGICIVELGDAPCIQVCSAHHVFHG
mmetsp:Transcript_18310/g.22829  ORF Transcript_18310/g.22829 Transcript_18310/m.22829 type:complete len:84 (+) Transcript_18310:51-302(+)